MTDGDRLLRAFVLLKEVGVENTFGNALRLSGLSFIDGLHALGELRRSGRLVEADCKAA